MTYSQPRAAACAAMIVTVALLFYGVVYDSTTAIGILLLAVPVVAFAAMCGWKAAR